MMWWPFHICSSDICNCLGSISINILPWVWKQVNLPPSHNYKIIPTFEGIIFKGLKRAECLKLDCKYQYSYCSRFVYTISLLLTLWVPSDETSKADTVCDPSGKPVPTTLTSKVFSPHSMTRRKGLQVPLCSIPWWWLMRKWRVLLIWKDPMYTNMDLHNHCFIVR